MDYHLSYISTDSNWSSRFSSQWAGSNFLDRIFRGLCIHIFLKFGFWQQYRTTLSVIKPSIIQIDNVIFSISKHHLSCQVEKDLADFCWTTGADDGEWRGAALRLKYISHFSESKKESELFGLTVAGTLQRLIFYFIIFDVFFWKL